MGANVAEVNAENFGDLLASDVPVLVDFWAPWCGPCRALAPTIDQLADELAGQVKVVKCNVDENQDIAMQYHVMSIPTLVVLKGGEEATRMVGAAPKGKIAEEIAKFV